MAFRELHPAFELLDLVQSPSTILIRLLIESVQLGDPAEPLRPIAIGLRSGAALSWLIGSSAGGVKGEASDIARTGARRLDTRQGALRPIRGSGT